MTEKPDFLVRASDLHAVGYCRKGARQFAEFHKLDYKTFLGDGLPASQLAALHDGLADRFLDAVRKARGL